MKTKEELNTLKAEVEALNKKLAELTGEELEQVVGGDAMSFDDEKVYGFIPPDGGGRDVFVYYSNSDLCTAE